MRRVYVYVVLEKGTSRQIKHICSLEYLLWANCWPLQEHHQFTVIICIYCTDEHVYIFFSWFPFWSKCPQMPTTLRYGIKKITFFSHICVFGIERFVFRQFFFQKTLSDCFNKQICIYPRLKSEKNECSSPKRRSIFPTQKKLRTMSIFD